ncbi:hypothetical protein [Planococcus versutus]|uniref:hypothetical protein n=1 Tax=Planococcus versutus TaxID=1302659 RepID=UPI001390030F|nr:hypothetical protein [Planococcus versutus]
MAAQIPLEANDFSLEFLLKDKKKLPDKKHLAIVSCKEGIHSFKMSCRIYDRTGILRAQQTLVETMPTLFEYARFLGKPSWNNNQVL